MLTFKICPIEMHWKQATTGRNTVTLAIPHSRQERLQKKKKISLYTENTTIHLCKSSWKKWVQGLKNQNSPLAYIHMVYISYLVIGWDILMPGIVCDTTEQHFSSMEDFFQWGHVNINNSISAGPHSSSTTILFLKYVVF